MSYQYGERANEFLMPDDARQFGFVCSCGCGRRNVVYHITRPAPGFPVGHYTLPCLARLCIRAGMVPTPMATPLFDTLKGEIERQTGKRLLTTAPVPLL